MNLSLCVCTDSFSVAATNFRQSRLSQIKWQEQMTVRLGISKTEVFSSVQNSEPLWLNQALSWMKWVYMNITLVMRSTVANAVRLKTASSSEIPIKTRCVWQVLSNPCHTCNYLPPILLLFLLHKSSSTILTILCKKKCNLCFGQFDLCHPYWEVIGAQ